MGSQIANIVCMSNLQPILRDVNDLVDISSPFSFVMRCMDFMETLFKRITHLTNSACHAGCVSAGYEMMRLRDPVEH